MTLAQTRAFSFAFFLRSSVSSDWASPHPGILTRDFDGRD